jgi:hypothetical protein
MHCLNFFFFKKVEKSLLTKIWSIQASPSHAKYKDDIEELRQSLGMLLLNTLKTLIQVNVLFVHGMKLHILTLVLPLQFNAMVGELLTFRSQ